MYPESDDELVPCYQGSGGEFYFVDPDLSDGEVISGAQCDGCGSCSYQVFRSDDGSRDYVMSVADDLFEESGSEACEQKYLIVHRRAAQVVF